MMMVNRGPDNTRKEQDGTKSLNFSEVNPESTVVATYLPTTFLETTTLNFKPYRSAYVTPLEFV